MIARKTIKLRLAKGLLDSLAGSVSRKSRTNDRLIIMDHCEIILILRAFELVRVGVSVVEDARIVDVLQNGCCLCTVKCIQI